MYWAVSAKMPPRWMPMDIIDYDSPLVSWLTPMIITLSFMRIRKVYSMISITNNNDNDNDNDNKNDNNNNYINKNSNINNNSNDNRNNVDILIILQLSLIRLWRYMMIYVHDEKKDLLNSQPIPKSRPHSRAGVGGDGRWGVGYVVRIWGIIITL